MKERRTAHDTFVIKRTFAFDREVVFASFASPEAKSQWFAGPAGWQMLVRNMDFRAGGQLLYSLRMPDGQEMWGKFVYREILPPDRLVFVTSFSDQEGAVTRAPFNPKWPLEILNILTLSEHFSQTRLVLMGEPVNPTAEELELFESMLDSLHEGFSGTFDQLAAYLKTL